VIIAANQVTEEGLRIFSTVHIFTVLDITARKLQWGREYCLLGCDSILPGYTDQHLRQNCLPRR